MVLPPALPLAVGAGLDCAETAAATLRVRRREKGVVESIFAVFLLLLLLLMSRLIVVQVSE